MTSCDILAKISMLACAIADKKSPEELALTASIFNQLGDSRATLAAQQALCDCKKTEE